MVTLVNRAKVNTATAGTGTITLGAAVDGYQTFSAAGVTNGNVVRYVIEDGAGWEIGTGTYTATGSTLTRTVSESSNGGAAISLGGDATIFVGLLASDIVQVSDVGVTVQAYDANIVSDATYVHTDNNYTTAEKSKLAGVETGANNYSFPYSVSQSSTANSVVQRDSSGDINARLFRSEYDSTNAGCEYFMTQVNTGTNNYLRPSTLAQARSAIGKGYGTGSVGSYAFLRANSTSTVTPAGTLVTGSTMRYGDINYSKSGTPAGTWRCMGYAANRNYATVYLRIS